MGKRAGGAAGARHHSAHGHEHAAHHHHHHKKKHHEDEFEDDPDEVKLPRNGFPASWIPQASDAAHAKIGPSEVVREHGVPPDVFTEMLDKDVLEEVSCKSMPFTLLLVFAYACVIIENDNASQVNAVEDSIAFDIGENANFAFVGPMGFKSMWDVNSYQDFWSWLKNGLVPLIFVQSRGFSENYFENDPLSMLNASGASLQILEELESKPWLTNDTRRGLYINHNRIVGGLRLSQERLDEDPTGEIELECASPKALKAVYNMKCVGGFGYEMDPEMWDARATAKDCSGVKCVREREQWLYEDQSIGAIQNRVWQLERTDWLDKRTKKVEVALPIYNAEYGMHAMIHINFFFSRAGHIWKAIIPLSTFADLLDRPFKIAADITFIVCLLKMLFQEAVLVYRVVRAKGVVGILGEFMQPQNALDIVGVLAGSAVVTMMGFMFKFVGDLNVAGAFLGSGVKVTREVMEDYIWELENVIHFYHKLRLVMAAYPLVIVFRLFKTFSAQARLAVVTNSLQKASVDLVHFLIVFLAIFGIYAIAAVSLFGHSVDDMTTMSRTMTSTFLAMLGDFDWDEVKVAGRLEAGIWFWTFMLLVSMILMNMLIAIVMDAYSEVKDAAKDSKTMGEEILLLMRRTIGERASLRNTIGLCLKKCRIVTIDASVPLMEICIVVKGKDHALKVKKKRDIAKYKEWQEQAYHHKGGASTEDAPIDPAKHPELYEVPNLKVASLCKMVYNLQRAQAHELLLDMVNRYSSGHRRPASYEDCRLHLQGLLHDLKALKHTTRECLTEPNTQVPDKSFLMRCAVDGVWANLKTKEPDHAEHIQSGEAPQNFEQLLSSMETELKSVRTHVEEELAKVSGKHWQLSKVREERVALENACQVMQERATQLAVQNGQLHSRIPGSAQAPDDNGEALNLMQHLATEQRRLHTQLTSRGLDLRLHSK